MTRTCPTCGTALAADANPRRRYCSQRCRFANPERRAADAERHRRRYHQDPDYRARQIRAASDRQARATGPRLELDDPADRAAVYATAAYLHRDDRRLLLDAEPDPASVLAIVLDWCDELLMQPAVDELRLDIQHRADVALSTTPEALAALAAATRPDQSGTDV